MARGPALISSVWANGVLFQLVWFAAVLGGARGEPLWGWAALGLLTAQVLTTRQWRTDLAFGVVCMAIGFLADSLWSWAGVLDYSTGGSTGLEIDGGLAPGWILTLWAATGLSLNHSLGWFRARPLLGGIAAGLVAPVSYLAGERLGAVGIPDATLLGWIALSWVPVFAILFALTHTLDTPAHEVRDLHAHDVRDTHAHDVREKTT